MQAVGTSRIPLCLPCVHTPHSTAKPQPTSKANRLSRQAITCTALLHSPTQSDKTGSYIPPTNFERKIELQKLDDTLELRMNSLNNFGEVRSGPYWMERKYTRYEPTRRRRQTARSGVVGNIIKFGKCLNAATLLAKSQN